MANGAPGSPPIPAGQILLRQAPQAIDEITTTFNLSDGERQFLLSADRGRGLLSTGTHRVAFQAIASPAEHHLVTTDPVELATYDTASARAGFSLDIAQDADDSYDLTPDGDGYVDLG